MEMQREGRGKKEHTYQEMAAQSLTVHSTNILMEELCVLGNVQHWRLTEAVRCHTDDTFRGREWPRFTDVASFP